jgi:hypothetical protein
MLGMVFCELLEMIEQRFSFDVADAVLARAGLNGSWTAVGNYDDADLVSLVVALSAETGVPVPELLRAYGHHLFGVFRDRYAQFMTPHSTAIGFFGVLESHVHTEVRKLYPTACPPLFELIALADGRHVLDYRSTRGLAAFAHGLVEASLAHFGDDAAALTMEELSEGGGTHVRFHLPGPA